MGTQSEGVHLSTHNPDTGLPYVSWNHLSTKVREPFAPLFKTENAKVVYYFAVIMKISHLGLPQQRVVIITHDSLIQCMLNSDITRCVLISDIEDIIISHDNWFGVVIPKQCDMLFKLSPQQVAYMRQVLAVLYKHLSGSDLKFNELRETANIKGMLRLQKPPNFSVKPPTLLRRKDVIKGYQKRSSSVRSAPSPCPLNLAPLEADSPLLSPRSPQPVPLSSIERPDEGTPNVPKHSPSAASNRPVEAIKYDPVPPPRVTSPVRAHVAQQAAREPAPQPQQQPAPPPTLAPAPAAAPASPPTATSTSQATADAYQQRLKELEKHQSRSQPPVRSPSPPSLEGKFHTGTTVLACVNDLWSECRVTGYNGHMYTLSHKGAQVVVPEGKLRPATRFKKGDLVKSTRRLYSERGDVIPEGGAGTVLSVPGEHPSAAAVVEMAGYRINVGPSDIEVLLSDELEYNEGDELEFFDTRTWRPCTVILKEGGTYLVQTDECDHFNINGCDARQYLRRASCEPAKAAVAPAPAPAPARTSEPMPALVHSRPVFVPEADLAPTQAPELAPAPGQAPAPEVSRQPAEVTHGTLVVSADQYQPAPVPPAPPPREPVKQGNGRKGPPRSQPAEAPKQNPNLAEGLPTSFTDMMSVSAPAVSAPAPAPAAPAPAYEEYPPVRGTSVLSERRSPSTVRGGSSDREDLISLDFANKVFDDYSRQVRDLQNRLNTEVHDHNVIARLTMEKEMLLKKIEAIKHSHDIDMKAMAAIDDDFASILPLQSMTADGVQQWLLNKLMVSEKLASCFRGLDGAALYALSEDAMCMRIGGNAAAAAMLHGQVHKEVCTETDTTTLKWILASRQKLIADLAAGYDRLRALKVALKKATKAHGTMQEKVSAADKQASSVVKTFKELINNYVLPKEKVDLGLAEACEMPDIPMGVLSPFEERVLGKLCAHAEASVAAPGQCRTMYISPPQSRARRTTPRKVRERRSPSRSISPSASRGASRTPSRSLTPLSAFGRTNPMYSATRTRTVTPPYRSRSRHSLDRY
eukprot:TRINITY_DN12240_c0_g1_i1.p1 TRINITY_DN12240_c0_g1~~TRINITY_DN12240_c0_g1_i1.p1  ORF type:complete len:1035 (+),score=256.64 TRINITY_DN12240_c0_g1_i1:243-3347(+)